MRIRIEISEAITLRWLERLALVVLVLSTLLIVARIVIGTRYDPVSAASLPKIVSTEAVVPPPATGVRKPAPFAVPPRTAVVNHRLPDGKTQPATPGVQLHNEGGTVVVASNEADAADLGSHPDKLTALIQTGSIFFIANDTQVTIGETRAGLVQIHIMNGAFEGQVGWVQAKMLARLRRQ